MIALAKNGKLKLKGEVCYVAPYFPVGSIYMSVVNVNPSTYFGGTWEAWGSGRVPVGVNTSETEFNSVEKTGGEKKHTLTTNEMPSHNHGVGTYRSSGGSETRYYNPTGAQQVKNYTEYAGGGEAHNNLQPYINCYMCKRTT